MIDSGVEWLGDIPTHWNVIKGRYAFTLLNRPVLPDDEIITCFRDGEVTLRKNRREDGFTMADYEYGYQGIETGDLIIHGMDGFAGAIGISDSRGKGSPILNVLDTQNCKKYMVYYLRSLAYSNVFVSLFTGIRVRSCDLRWKKIADLPILVPPLGEQSKIATFLDSKTSEIKSLIDNLNKQIESLKEYKKSLIYKCVTKGLDDSVPLKDSGIKWIGQIPENWHVERLQWHLREIKENNNPIKTDKVLSLTNKDGVIPYEEKGAQGNISKEDYSQYKLAYPDTIVANSMNILIGSVGICNCFGCVSPVYYVYKANNQSNLKFINYLFQTIPFQKELRKYANGILEIRLRVSSDDILKRQVCFPPLEEQNQIVDFLDNKCGKIDELISMQEAEIDKLTEYQKSLIYEYVTGKKEVV